MRVASRVLGVLAMFVMLAAPALAQSNRYGVIVAVENYKNTAQVEYAEEDAELVREMFEKVLLIPPGNIQVKLDPTSTELERLFGTASRGGSIGNRITRDDAEVYVYFAGHGSKELDPATNTMRGYLLGTDSVPDQLSDTGYGYEQLVDQLGLMRDQKFPQGRVVLLMESCFSGRYNGGELLAGVSASAFGGDPEPIKDISEKRDVITIAAATGSQTAYWDPDIENSVFTRYLADGLFGQADGAGTNGTKDGSITFRELQTYLRDTVPARAAAIQPNAYQTPEIAEADLEAVLVALPEGYDPSSERLEVARQIEERRMRLEMQEDVSALSTAELREKLKQLRLRYATCTVDCFKLLQYQQRIEDLIITCNVERRVFRGMLTGGDVRKLTTALADSQCAEATAIARSCISSGVADSDACQCLKDDLCTGETVAAVDPPADPACAGDFETARAGAAEQSRVALLTDFRRDRPACPQAAEVDAAVAELCRVKTQALVSSNDPEALAAFVSGMSECPGIAAVKSRQETVLREIGLSEKSSGPAPAPASCDDARSHFDLARDLNTAEALQAHVDFYGSCPFAPLARAMLARLGGEAGDRDQRAADDPDPLDAPSPVADGTTLPPDWSYDLLPWPVGEVVSVALEPRGDWLASASDDGTIQIWDLNSKDVVRTMPEHGSKPRFVAASPQPGADILASGGEDGVITLWKPSSGTVLRTLAGHGGPVTAAAFSSDGALLASASHDSAIKLWTVETGAELRMFDDPDDYYQLASVAMSADGRLLAGGSGDGTIRLWDLASGALLRKLTGHQYGIAGLAFSPDGRTLASASEDTTVKLWATDTGSLQRTLSGHTITLTSVAFSPDGALLISGSRDGSAKLWDATSGALVRTLEGHSGFVNAVAFAADGAAVATGSSDKTIKLWQVASGSEIMTLKGHGSGVEAVALSPDGRLLVSASEGLGATIWRFDTRERASVLEGHAGPVGAVAFSPAGSLVATGSDDRTAKLWNAETGALERTFEGHEDYVKAVAFSPDGEMLATGSNDHTVKLWNAATGMLLRTLAGHEEWVHTVAFSPDGRIVATGGWDDTVKLWDTQTGALLRTLTGHSSIITSVAFSPDGQTLASASWDSTIKIWNVATGALERTQEGHTGFVNSVAFSPDGQVLASGSRDRTIRLWDARTGENSMTLTGHRQDVLSVAFRPDSSRFLASGSLDQSVRLWELKEGSSEGMLVAHADGEWAALAEGALHISSPAAAAHVLVRRPDGGSLLLRDYDGSENVARSDISPPATDDDLGDGLDSDPDRELPEGGPAGSSALAAACDAQAASPDDLDRPVGVPGISFANVDGPAAVSACEAAVAENPNEPRLVFQLGFALDKAGRDAEAIERYRQASEMNYRHAYTLLGTMYDFGEGAAKDPVEAVRLYRQGADLGDRWGQRMLGAKYNSGDGVAQDYFEAARYLRMAAEQGDVYAQFDLAQLYLSGGGVSANPAEAASWFKRAAEAGHAPAQRELALLYRNGNGVTPDHTVAADWLRKAADQGDAEAQNWLGLAYESGEGVTADKVEAVRWYRLSADQGNAFAQNNLAVMYHDGKGVEQSATEALLWYEKAVAQGEAMAHSNLATLYMYGGKGVSVDEHRAAELLLDAYALGNTSATNILTVERGLQHSVGLRQSVQRVLQERGFYSGRIDGVFGQGTIAAVERYKEQKSS